MVLVAPLPLPAVTWCWRCLPTFRAQAKGSSEGEKEPSGAGAAAPAAAPAAGPAAGPGEAGSDSDGGDAADGGSGGGEGLHFDVLERQINEALVRLSLSEEQVAASLRQVAAGEAAEVAAAEAQGNSGGAGPLHSMLGLWLAAGPSGGSSPCSLPIPRTALPSLLYRSGSAGGWQRFPAGLPRHLRLALPR